MRISDYIPTNKDPIIEVMCYNCFRWRLYSFNCGGCNDAKAMHIIEEVRLKHGRVKI